MHINFLSRLYELRIIAIIGHCEIHWQCQKSLTTFFGLYNENNYVFGADFGVKKVFRWKLRDQPILRIFRRYSAYQLLKQCMCVEYIIKIIVIALSLLHWRWKFNLIRRIVEIIYVMYNTNDISITNINMLHIVCHAFAHSKS